MSDRNAALVSALEDKYYVGKATETDDDEVYVATQDGTLAHMDDMCVVAHDHGFVPRGIVDSGAVRFKPRTDVNI